MERVDLVIIGAGWSGLAMAKTYQQVCGSDCSMLILDSASTLGGSWAYERLYPGLKTNSVVGSYEYSDFPMDAERYSLRNQNHIPGHVVQQYLVDFSDHFGIYGKIRLRTDVEAVVKNEDDGTWRIDYNTYSSDNDGSNGNMKSKHGTLLANKLVVATGLTSQPNMPTYPGQTGFQGHVFHAKELRARASDLKDAKHNIIVVGANKSAWDACYTASHTTDATVHMLIRPSGRGPTWIWRKLPGLPSFNVSRLSSTRLFSWFDPCPLGSPRQRWFQRTWLGSLFCAVFWGFLDRCLLLAAGYYLTGSRHVDDRDTLKKLRPWYSNFWMGNAQSNDNYETTWLRSGRVRVYHSEIERLLPGQERSVRFSDGQSLHHVDAVVVCTGWEYAPNLKFGPPSVAKYLGLPSAKQEEHDRRSAVLKARKTIDTLWPALSSPPQMANRGRVSSPPYRLYRFLVPPDASLLQKRNIAFIGCHQTIHTAIVAQAQALWITAFLQGRIGRLGDNQDIEEWTYLHTEYQQLRRLGSPFPDLVVDTVPYVDLLLQDLGLSSARKTKAGSGWWAELMAQYTPGDYHGLVEEWMEKETVLRNTGSANR